MKKILSLLFALSLTACAGGFGTGSKTDIYEGFEASGKITNFSSDSILVRQLDLINSVRQENGSGPVRLNNQLTAAALTHARDIANQQRAWNYGSDKSTPYLRGQRAGYTGTVVGELVAETYLGEITVFSTWYNAPLSREVILNSSATDVGIAYFMDNANKVWWVTVFGSLAVQ